jgi:undecaprenyl phosphate-alpha-L-ara4N flippase subunit ArnE
VWVNWIPLFLIAAILESVGQISFKKAALAYREVQGVRYYLKLAGNKWALSGILSYSIEMVLWIFLLSRIPLSIAFPLAGLQQLIILVASYLFMNERINRVEWLGAGLIALGLSAIATAG